MNDMLARQRKRFKYEHISTSNDACLLPKQHILWWTASFLIMEAHLLSINKTQNYMKECGDDVPCKLCI